MTLTTSSSTEVPFEERLRHELLLLHEERFGPASLPRRRLTSKPYRRLVGLLASSAAVAIVIALIAGGVFAPPQHPSLPRHGVAGGGEAKTDARLTTKDVLTAAESRLADTSNDVLEVQSDVDGGVSSTTTWMDSATGQFKSYSEVNGQPANVVYLDDDKSVSSQVVSVDYKDQEWWSYPAQNLTMSPETPQDIATELSNGQYTLVGPQQIGGEDTLELTSTRGDAINEMWVDATSYLPVKFVAGVGTSMSESSTYTWTPSSQVDASIFDVTIPTGFRQLPTPPSGLHQFQLTSP